MRQCVLGSVLSLSGGRGSSRRKEILEGRDPRLPKHERETMMIRVAKIATSDGRELEIEYENRPGTEVEDIEVVEIRYADGQKIPESIQRMILETQEQELYNKLYADFTQAKMEEANERFDRLDDAFTALRYAPAKTGKDS